MAKYRKKPIIIDAIQWTGDNEEEIYAWEREVVKDYNLVVRSDGGFVYVDTLEGSTKAKKGDWIICGMKGETYPCKPDIFEMIYELVE